MAEWNRFRRRATRPSDGPFYEIMIAMLGRIVRWCTQDPQILQALRKAREEYATSRLSRQGRRQLERLISRHLFVHLGCGPDVRQGWINIDLPIPQMGRPATYIAYDLRKGLPLPNASCQMIYSSHFFEHLPYDIGVSLMRDCYRCLEPGGTFRATLPNFKSIFRAYLENDEAYFSLVPHEWLTTRTMPTASLIDFVNWAVYQYGEHQCLWDEDKMIRVFKDIGFRRAEAAEFLSGIDVDSEIRRRYSFYVEGIK